MVGYRIDKESMFYIDNWMVQANLICDKKSYLGILGALAFLGASLACFFLPYCADRFGRYPVFMVTMFFQIPLFIAALYTKQLGVLYVCCFFLGVGLIGRFTTGFVLLTEVLVKRHQALVGTLLMVGDSAATLYITLYLRFFHYANTMVWLGLIMNIVSFIGCFWIYESPSWLVSIGRTHRAKEILKKIAEMNGVKEFHIHGLKKEEKVYQKPDREEDDQANMSQSNMSKVGNKKITESTY